MVSAEGVQPLAELIDFIDFFHIFPFNASHFLFYRITSKSYMFFCPSQYFLANFRADKRCK